MTDLMPSRRPALLLVIALVVSIVATVLVALPATSEAASVTVVIEDFEYTPGTIKVQVGDTVTWVNRDTAPHTVTGASGPEKLDSPTLEEGDSWSFTFTEPGTYEYFCAIHPDMVGTVVVTGASSEKPKPKQKPTTEPEPPSGHDGTEHEEPAPSDDTPADESPDEEPGEEGVSCPALSEAVLAPFVVHFNKAHLERSPGEQAQDALDVDQYAKTHTVMFGSMFAPLFHLVQTAPSGLNPFVVHFNKAHLERSPGEQARDAADADQYVKTHTVMFGDMLEPTTGAMTGSETC